jgi:hypothetical protein
VERRERKAIAAAQERIRNKDLTRRRLILIPVLDRCRKARNKIPRGDEKMRLGATVVLNELEFLLREK